MKIKRKNRKQLKITKQQQKTTNNKKKQKPIRKITPKTQKNNQTIKRENSGQITKNKQISEKNTKNSREYIYKQQIKSQKQLKRKKYQNNKKNNRKISEKQKNNHKNNKNMKTTKKNRNIF